MNLFFCSTTNNEIGDKLLSFIEKLVPKEKIKIFQKFDGFHRKLHQYRYARPVAILLIANKEELLNVLSFKDLLQEVRLVLILPDRKEDTIAIGQCLSPSLLCFSDSKLNEIYSILVKILIAEMSRERKIKLRLKKGWQTTWI
jgi:hypothetical protein